MDTKPKDALHGPVAIRIAKAIAPSEVATNGAKARPASSLHDQHHTFAAHHGGAGQQCIVSLGRLRRCAGPDLLGRGEGLSRQQGLVDLQSMRFQHHSVSRHEIADAQMHDIARHNPRNGEGDDGAIANHIGMNRNRLAQRLRGEFGSVFLHDVERERHRNDRGDDDKAADVAAKPGNRRRDQQNRHQRIEQALADLAQKGQALHCLGTILPKRVKPPFRLDL